MNIDVVDMEDSVLGGNRQQWLAYLRANSTVIEMYGMCNGVAQMVSDVIQRALPGSIEALRIWSHGYPGGQNVTAGASGSGAPERATIAASNLGDLAGDLVRLQPYFQANGRLELRGCSVGQGPAGEQLLVGLARLVGVPVQAAPVVQSTGNWAGSVYQAYPNGALACVIGTPVGPGP
jgi:hypothetical protein